MAPLSPLAEEAQKISQTSTDAKFWLLFLILAGLLYWLFNTSREREHALRTMLDQRQAAREDELRELVVVVQNNTKAVEQNSKILTDADYALRRSAEILEKFVS